MRSKQSGRTCILPQRFSKNYGIGTQDKRCYLYGIKQVGTKDQLHSSLSKKMETLKLSTFPQLLQRKILKNMCGKAAGVRQPTITLLKILTEQQIHSLSISTPLVLPIPYLGLAAKHSVMSIGTPIRRFYEVSVFS